MSIRDSTDVLQPLPLFASATLFSCALPKPIEFDELRLPQFGENVNYPCNETHRKQNTDINTENIALLLFVPPIQLSVCVLWCVVSIYILPVRMCSRIAQKSLSKMWWTTVNPYLHRHFKRNWIECEWYILKSLLSLRVFRNVWWWWSG